MSYSTDDCKNFLITLFPKTSKKNWKRTRKYTNDQGQIARDFVCGDIEQTIVETPSGLQPYTQTAPKPLDLPDNYQDYLNQEKVEITLFGDNPHKNDHLTNDYEKFKHVLMYGIDWESKEGDRSCFDFASSLNFKSIVLQDKCILDQTILYTSCMLDFFFDLDETYSPHHCSTSHFDDSAPDLISVITRIKEAYVAHSMPLIVRQSSVKNCLSIIQSIKDIMSEEPELIKKANSELNKLKKLLLSLHAV